MFGHMPATRFQGIIFDMDGTITVPTLDFQAIRAEIGLADGELLAEIAKLPADAQARAWGIIERHEQEAMRRQRLQPGCAALLTDCRTAGLRLGLLTRNRRESVDHLCARFGLAFDAVLSREFPLLKPHPGPVLHILAKWDMAPRDALMVGDYIHDIESGHAAGTQTCFFRNPGYTDFSAAADHAVGSMAELRVLLGL